MEKTELVKRGGVLLKLHSLEPGASAPRRKGDGPVDTVVLHYTACANLPRALSVDRVESLILRATRAGNVETAQAIWLRSSINFMQNPDDPNNTACIPDSIAQAAISCASPREAIAHYFVASTVVEVRRLSAPEMPETFRIQGIAHRDLVVPVVETVPVERIAHHVGPLSGITNRMSVGIEVCYPGPAPRKICKTQDQARDWFESRGWLCPDVWSREVCLDGLPRWFAPIPFATYNAVVGLIVDLCRRIPTIRHLCSHYVFATTKRIDPDPPLSIQKIAAEVGESIGRRLDTGKPKR
ncbi:MAG: N-acetylmuramoyl-L-alanine amidase [Deltaproteobacteria bacterium]|nr:N-acetylmuramoyl-L-alanine amidase [Deltaproteobacteria bacterium]